MSSSGAGEGARLDAARLQLPELPDDDPLDRLLGDQDLLLRMQLENFTGPTWDRVAGEFARYGLSVWRGWMHTGKAYVEASRGAPGTINSPAQPLTSDEIEGLLDEVVTEALVAFRDKVLRKNKWDPQRGASLKTFFIGQCKFRFRDCYRRFERDRQRHGGTRNIEDPTVVAQLPRIQTADTRLLEDEARNEVLSALSTETARTILQLHDLGYNHTEIAAELNLDDERVVRNALYYQRAKLRQQWENP